MESSICEHHCSIAIQHNIFSFFYPFFASSLFAAQASASRVIAVEASEKMAAVATRVKCFITIKLLDLKELSV